MIEKKGYSFDESSKIALKIFDEHENDVMPIECYIDFVVSKEEYQEEYIAEWRAKAR